MPFAKFIFRWLKEHQYTLYGCDYDFIIATTYKYEMKCLMSQAGVPTPKGKFRMCISNNCYQSFAGFNANPE